MGVITLVRCAYTDCKNNVKELDGYFCNQKIIHLFSYWSSHQREKGNRMMCEQYKVRKGYAPAEEQTRG